MGKTGTRLASWPAKALSRYKRGAVFNPDGLPVWADRHLLEGNIAAHEHEFLEIALVTRGAALHVSRDGDRALRPGSVVIVAPNEWHAYDNCKDLVVFDCFVAQEVLEGLLGVLGEALPLLHLVLGERTISTPHLRLEPDEMSRCIGELCKVTDTTPGERSLARLLGHLLVYLDIVDHAWATRSGPDGGQPPRQHPAASGAAALMEADLAHPWTLAELAGQLGIERTHLVRVFRRAFGVPPMVYLKQRRAQAAGLLLIRSDQPVAEIGVQVGWDEPAHFARRFRSYYGLSPTAYRKRAASAKPRVHHPAATEVPLPVSGARYAPLGDGGRE